MYFLKVWYFFFNFFSRLIESSESNPVTLFAEVGPALWIQQSVFLHTPPARIFVLEPILVKAPNKLPSRFVLKIYIKICKGVTGRPPQV